MADDRDITRAHTVIDHAAATTASERLVTIVGGKFATYRLMAEETVDEVVPPARRSIGRAERPTSCCPTQNRPRLLLDRQPAPRAGADAATTISSSASASSCPAAGSRRRCAAGTRSTSTTSGAWCGWAWARARAGSASTGPPGILHGVQRLDGEQANRSLLDFLQERWKGVQPILYGDQLRQARYDDWIFQGLLDIEHVEPTPQVVRWRTRVRFDVVVIGAGTAGMTAAVATGRGRPAGGGAGQGRGVDPAGAGDDRRARLRRPSGSTIPADALPGFLTAHPDHPYHRVGVDALGRAIEWLRERVDVVHLRRARSRTTSSCPRPSGAVKPTAIAARDHGRRRRPSRRSLPAVRPPRLQGLLSRPGRRQSGRSGQGRGPSGGAASADRRGGRLRRVWLRPAIRVRPTSGGRWSARCWPPWRVRTRIGFPAVLGLGRAARGLVGAAGRASAGPVFEISTLPPSVPGIRLGGRARGRPAPGRRPADDRLRGGRRPPSDGGRVDARCAFQTRGPHDRGRGRARSCWPPGGFSPVASRWRPTRPSASHLRAAGVRACPRRGEPMFSARVLRPPSAVDGRAGGRRPSAPGRRRRAVSSTRTCTPPAPCWRGAEPWRREVGRGHQSGHGVQGRRGGTGEWLSWFVGLARPLHQVHDLRDLLPGVGRHAAVPRAQVRRSPGRAVPGVRANRPTSRSTTARAAASAPASVPTGSRSPRSTPGPGPSSRSGPASSCATGIIARPPLQGRLGTPVAPHRQPGSAAAAWSDGSSTGPSACIATPPVPKFAGHTFQRWARQPPAAGDGHEVGGVLPRLQHQLLRARPGRRPLPLLEHNGFKVIIPKGQGCCGLPLQSNGLFDYRPRRT